MREIVDLVDSVAGTWTRTVKIVVIGGIVVAGLFMLMITLTAPAVVEEVGDRAERISDKAMAVAREEGRAHALAEEGWGYSDGNSDAAYSTADGFSDDASERYDSDYDPEWGEPSEEPSE